MDLYDKAIVLQLFAFFEELIKKESEKAVKPRQANKKEKSKESLTTVASLGGGRRGRPAPGVTIFG